MARRVRFRRNPLFERQMRADPGYESGLAKIAGRGADKIRAAAPTGGTGYYRRSVRSQGTSIVISDPFWHLIEWGSANNPPYAPIRRGIRAAGLHLKDDRQ